jgi:hypothetical protein
MDCKIVNLWTAFCGVAEFRNRLFDSKHHPAPDVVLSREDGEGSLPAVGELRDFGRNMIKCGVPRTRSG